MIRTIMLAFALAGAAPAVADAAASPDHVGEMSISYIPKMCIMAPCPPGFYRVSAAGETLGEGDVVAIERNGDYRQYRGSYLSFETFSGELWVGGEDRVDADGVGIPPGMLRLVIREE